MREEKFQTLHPEGKEGVNILKRRYDLVANTILTILREEGGSLSFSKLIQKGKPMLEDQLDGSPSWYITTVKLDLEARGILQRDPGEGPQQIMIHEELAR